MPFVKTPHGKIHYHIKGNGPPLVLVRGLGRWSVHWYGWDDQLARHFTVITFDNKGLGLTTSPMRPWHSLKTIADDISFILRHERLESAHIAGTSLGGMVAMVFALEHPAMTRSISVIAASIGRGGHMRISLAAAKLLMTAPLRRGAMYSDLARLLTSRATPDALREKLAHDWREEDKKHKQPILTVVSQLLAAARFNKWEKLAKIQCPAQIIVGSDDQFVPRGNSLFLHSRLSGSTLVEIPNAGHEPHIDQPEAMTSAVKTFTALHDHPPA